MSNGKVIDITFDEKGNPTIETSGFSGGECLQATLAVEAALGAKTSDRKKQEFHNVAGQAQRQRAGR